MVHPRTARCKAFVQASIRAPDCRRYPGTPALRSFSTTRIIRAASAGGILVILPGADTDGTDQVCASSCRVGRKKTRPMGRAFKFPSKLRVCQDRRNLILDRERSSRQVLSRLGSAADECPRFRRFRLSRRPPSGTVKLRRSSQNTGRADCHDAALVALHHCAAASDRKIRSVDLKRCILATFQRKNSRSTSLI
jgi:hypothetical protein